MKKLNVFVIALVGILFASTIFMACTNGSDKAEIACQKSIEGILSDVSKIAEAKGKVVTFEVSIKEGRFIKSNIVVVEGDKFVQDFAKAFNSDINNDTMKKKVIVSCTTGTSMTCEANDGLYVGGAVKACLDAEGCEGVCVAKLAYIPANVK